MKSKKIIAVFTALLLLVCVQTPAAFALSEPEACENTSSCMKQSAEETKDTGKTTPEEAASAASDQDEQQEEAVPAASGSMEAAPETAGSEKAASERTGSEEAAKDETAGESDGQEGSGEASGQKETLKENKTETIEVSFALLGDVRHDDSQTHLQKDRTLQPWIEKCSVQLKTGSTASELLQKILEDNQYTWRFDEQDQLVSVTRSVEDGGLRLENRDNGPDAGWMYSVNEKYPPELMKELVLNEGDQIIVHYSDDMAEELQKGDAAEEDISLPDEEITPGQAADSDEPGSLEDRGQAVEISPLKEAVQAGDADLNNAYGNTLDRLTETGDAAKWVSDTVWIVLAKARAGNLTQEQAEAYRASILETLEKSGSSRINQNQSSNNSRAILALTAAGFDPTNVEGYNLLQPLANIEYVKAQGINGPVWALLAFDSGGYEIPKLQESDFPGEEKVQTTREGLIRMLLGAQHKDGGWSYSGTASDVDMTSMVLQALAPYYKSNYEITEPDGSTLSVKDAVDKALSWLSSVQHDDGSFSSVGFVTSESSSQVIVALTSLGIDPAKDERFIKNGKGAIDSLLSFYVKGGGFKHVYSNDKYNGLASMQGYYALVSYFRTNGGANSLYQMDDVADGFVIHVDYEKEDADKPEKPDNPADDTKDDSSGGKDNSDKNKDNKQDSTPAKAAGATKSLTKSAGLIKLSGKMTKEAKVSISLIEAVVKRDLPKNAAKYSKEDIKAIENAYKEYMKLTPAEQLAVEKDKNWKPFCEITSKLGKVYHFDRMSGIDLSSNPEESLPWYVRLVVKETETEPQQAEKIAELLGEGGSLCQLYDIHFENSLDGKEWHPERIVTVRIPVPESLSGDPIAVHITDKGKIEFIKGTLLDGEEAGKTSGTSGGHQMLEIQAADFSPYGIAEMNGSVQELMRVQEKEEKGFLPWICIGGAAILALAGLAIARRKMTTGDEQ